MIKSFEYTIKLVVQHKELGTLDYITKEFDAQIEMNEDDYFNSFAVHSGDVLERMSKPIDEFLKKEKYSREDIDIISYEVFTGDPYIDIYFSETESSNVHDTQPDIEAEVLPDIGIANTPDNFMGRLLPENTIEWSWDLVKGCAYRLYDQDNQMIAEIGLKQSSYVESGFKEGYNVVRKLVAFDINGESNPTKHISIFIPEKVEEEDVVDLPALAFENDHMNVRKVEHIGGVKDRLMSIRSGVGYGLDLLTTPLVDHVVTEHFKFDMTLIGTIEEKQRRYTRIPFKYRVDAYGKELVRDYVDSKLSLRFKPWPVGDLKIKLNSTVNESTTETIKYDIHFQYDVKLPPKPIIISGGVYEDGEKKVDANITKNSTYPREKDTRVKVITIEKEVPITEPMSRQVVLDLMECVNSDSAITDNEIVGEPRIFHVREYLRDSNFLMTYVDRDENLVYAKCLASPEFYSKEEEIKLEISRRNGVSFDIYEKTEDIELVNVEGETYTGEKEIVTTISYEQVPKGVIVYQGNRGNLFPETIKVGEVLVARLEEPEEEYEREIVLDNSNKEISIHTTDMFPDLEGGEYIFEYERVSNHRGMTFKNTLSPTYDHTISTALIPTRIDSTEYFRFTGIPEDTLQEWFEKGAISEGSVNGRAPMQNDLDGKLDFVALAPKKIIPKDVSEVYYKVEIIETDNDREITCSTENQYNHGETTVNGDLITFTSDDYEEQTIFKKWHGPTIRSNEHTINSNSSQFFEQDVLNPFIDNDRVGEVFNLRLIVKSLNPNVSVEVVNRTGIHFKAGEYSRSVEFRGRILVPSQSGWAPQIHPGYYYINNREHFLYADKEPRGVYRTKTSPKIKEFLLSVRFELEDMLPGGETEYAGTLELQKLCRLPLDAKEHTITEESLINTFFKDIVATGIPNPSVINVVVLNQNSDMEFDYNNNGRSVVRAKSNYTETQVDILDELDINYCETEKGGLGYLEPIPRLGSPVTLIKDGVAYKHVSFIDGDGNATLTNIETVVLDGRPVVALEYNDIDTNTLKVTYNGDEIGIDEVINNLVYIDPAGFNIYDGMEVEASYRIKDSFVTDYNFDVSRDQAKLLVHNSNHKYENISVYYETNSSENYIAENIELNPLYSHIDEGFIFLTHDELPLNKLELNITPNEFSAHAKETAYVYVKALDTVGNPYSGAQVTVVCEHGEIEVDDDVSNELGIVTAKYHAPDFECVDKIVAVNGKYNRRDDMIINVHDNKEHYFMNLTAQEYEVAANGRVAISAKIYKENLVPLVGKTCTASVSDYFGEGLSHTQTTNSDGSVSFDIEPVINHPNDICRVTVSCEGVTEIIDVKVVR